MLFYLFDLFGIVNDFMYSVDLGFGIVFFVFGIILELFIFYIEVVEFFKIDL